VILPHAVSALCHVSWLLISRLLALASYEVDREQLVWFRCANIYLSRTRAQITTTATLETLTVNVCLLLSACPTGIIHIKSLQQFNLEGLMTFQQWTQNSLKSWGWKCRYWQVQRDWFEHLAMGFNLIREKDSSEVVMPWIAWKWLLNGQMLDSWAGIAPKDWTAIQGSGVPANYLIHLTASTQLRKMNVADYIWVLLPESYKLVCRHALQFSAFIWVPVAKLADAISTF